MRRVIWLPEGTHSDKPEQQAFIEALQKEAGLQKGADLVSADPEVLKGVIHSALQELEKPQRATSGPASGASRAKFVYLICDKRDRPATMDLRALLKREGFEVEIPLFEGDAATVQEANRDFVTQCDAVILFYGAGDEGWKYCVKSELKKMLGYAEKALPVTYIYLAGASTADKEELIKLSGPNLINGLGGFTEALMQPFLNALRS